MSGIESVGYLGLGMIVLFFTTIIFIRQLHNKNEELKSKIDELQENFDFIQDYALSWNSDIEKLKGSVHVMTSSIDLAPRLKGIEDALNGMLDIVKEEHTDAVKRHSEASERQIKPFCDAGDDDEHYADIPGDLDEGFEGEKSATEEQREALEYAKKTIESKKDTPSYHWIFPRDDHGEGWPILGEEYLVIGREQKTGEVVSGIGTWRGIKYDMNDGYDIDKVYAYVRLPSPSDVMNEVLDIRFKEG